MLFEELLEKYDNKWKEDTKALEAAVLLLDDLIKGGSRLLTLTVGEATEARDGLLNCMFTDLPSNMYYALSEKWDVEQNDE